MKLTLFSSYFRGIFDKEHGESYSRILKYFMPELITSLVMYSLVYFVDTYWIAQLESTNTTATLGVTNTLFHLITKMGEGFMVGTIVLAGHYNGLGDYSRSGRALSDVFWLTIISGGAISAALFFGAPYVYSIYGVPEKMIALGVPYLQLRAISVFFQSIYFAFVGFLRGIKRPRVPMYVYIVGAVVFLFFDFGLIFGRFGLPQMGFQGSALASIIQYIVMLVAMAAYVLYAPRLAKYSVSFLRLDLTWERVWELVRLSWPVILDKSTLAVSYLWLGSLINPMGKYVIASFVVIKDFERLAIQPAAAFAQVITFLSSNDHGRKDWEGIKSNTKKTVFLASLFVGLILLLFSINPTYFISIFDRKGKFTEFAAGVFPMLSIMVFFDLLQLILAGSLRGAANVQVVMWIRAVVVFGLFFPVSYLISLLPIDDMMLKFLLIYGSFYAGNAIMSLMYIWRFRGENWKTKKV
jgi:putative MATE family efflux protein